MHVTLSRHDSPVGVLLAARSALGLHALSFSEPDEPFDRVAAAVARGWPQAQLEEAPDDRVAQTLAAYFGGDLRALDGLEVALHGTPFQQSVWQALRTIPAGATLSYGALAGQLGRPGAMRAVGRANGQNPVAVVVPCHRVIASDGTLHGYGGGLWRKQWLLAHEGLRATPLFAKL